MPRDLDGLCPYCENAASSPARSVYPFCSSLHKSSHTAGHAKHAERKRVEACAGEGDGALVDGLVHQIIRVLSWKSGKREYPDYTVYRTDWTIACRRGSPLRELYPPKVDLVVTCLECVSYVAPEPFTTQTGRTSYTMLDSNYVTERRPPHAAKVWKEKYQRAHEINRNPPRRGR